MALKDGERSRIGCARKENEMVIKTSGFTIEERAEQLKKCCETIIDHAEEIVKGIDYSVEKKVTIHIPCHQTPTITIEQEFYSKKMMDHIMGK